MGQALFGSAAYANWDEGHTRRVKAITFGASLIMIVLGASWCTAFVVAARPMLALLDLAVALAGGGLLLLVLQNRLRAAAVLEAHFLPLTLVIFCLFDTVPPGLPRATHLHFLPVAVGCYFIFRQDGLYLKFIIPLFCLIAFVVFENVNLTIQDAALVIPEQVAWIGVLTNTVTSVAGLVLTVVIMNADLTVRRMMEVELRQAIAHDDFHLNYQPQVNEFGEVVGAEALIRWQHATMGDIPPARFISLAEETGLIVPIGTWVLRAACAQLALWQARPETEHLTLAVNVSASQFRQPDFVRIVSEIIKISGADPRRMKLELTESMFVENVTSTVEKMNQLKAIGLVWSLDDFGTGYSSLNILHRVPLGQIKIDRSFAHDIQSNKKMIVVIEAIMDMANKLSLNVVAEGVETEMQKNILIRLGCHLFQGFLFSRALDVDAFEGYSRHSRKAAPGPEPFVT